jgi:hypothetical protein
MLCNEFCQNSENLEESNCIEECGSRIKSEDFKDDIYNFLIRKHSLYQSKFQVLDNKIHKQSKFSSKSNLEESIKRSQAKINNLKKELMEEEKFLLRLYKGN